MMAVHEAADNALVSSEIESEDQQDSDAVFFDGQLSYVGHEATEVPWELIEDYTDRTVRLDLSFNRIQSLQGLERFVQLTELIVDNNQLSDDVIFPQISSLLTLSLNKNNLVELEPLLKQLKEKFPQLRYLSLLGNAACPNQLSSSENDEEDYQRYRYYVVFHLPHLKFLDSRAVHPSELQEATRRGKFLQVVRPPTALEEDEENIESTVTYTPLPSDKEENDVRHLAFYSKTNYTYLGLHSEGNRFIRSKDL